VAHPAAVNARHDIAYLIIAAFVAIVLLALLRARRARRRDRRSSFERIDIIERKP
jgi:hypothetical protein